MWSYTEMNAYDSISLHDCRTDNINIDGKHELEFLYEFHSSSSALYKCWVWKKNHGMEAECQLELTVKSIEYYWNEICKDREW